MLHAMEYLIHCIMFIAAPVKTEGKKKNKKVDHLLGAIKHTQLEIF